MYETLCSLGALLFQGVAAGLLVAGFTRWFEKRDSYAKYEAAAMFIAMEVTEHLIILNSMVAEHKLLPPDSPTKFTTSTWVELRSDLVGHMSTEQLAKIAAYYHSIEQIWNISLSNGSYCKNEKVIIETFAGAKAICALLGDPLGILSKPDELL